MTSSPKVKTGLQLFASRSVVILAFVFCNVTPVPGQTTKLNPIANPTLGEFREAFREPGRDFSTGPLWTWNDRLTEEQVRSTLRDLAGQHVKQVWVHPRPGLMTPYLSGEWFDMWKIALDEAKKLDMNVWIYDENSYPSGFAGGLVPAALPDSRGAALKFEERAGADSLDEDILYVYRPVTADGKTVYRNVTKEAKAAGKLAPLDGKEKYLLGKRHLSPQSPWHGGFWYVDLLKKGVTEKFIEVTFDAYKNVPEIREEFGKRVPGLFTDEPSPPGGRLGTWIAWNGEIPELFEKRFEYALADAAPSLVRHVGDWRKVRYDYNRLILDLFIDRFAKPCFEWCEANNLEFTGHYFEHSWPKTVCGPDSMAMYLWHHRPAIDLLRNQYDDTRVGAQFGNARLPKELASVANQTGRSRTLSENYGSGGWDLRFEDMKRLGDWSYALGVNTNNEHLSYVTVRGARKRDHPQSFSYHASWFEGYRILADYFTRLSYALSQGRQVNSVLVLEPTTTAWMYQGEKKLDAIGQSFTDLINDLERAHVEYDLGSEDTIARLGAVENKTFVIGQARYDLVILPRYTENLNSRTVQLLGRYVQNGGNLLCVDKMPERIDGLETARILPEGTSVVSAGDAVRQARERTARDGLTIETKPGVTTVFHHRRRLPEGEVLFLCNSDLQKEIDVLVKTDKTAELLDLNTGTATHSMKGPDITLKLAPAGSILLLLSNGKSSLPLWTGNDKEPLILEGSEVSIRRMEDNVLALDFVEVTRGDRKLPTTHAWRANRWVYEQHGLAGNPWERAVQFKDELITKTFPPGTGFEAVYRFTLENAVPDRLAIAIERADLYTVYCNGEKVEPALGDWWLDKSFLKVDLRKTAKVGLNEVRIAASPMRIDHELEQAYLLGDFSLRAAKQGFVVVPPRPLVLKVEEDDRPVLIHGTDQERIAWLSRGIDYRKGSGVVNDRSPRLVFDLGGERELLGLRIWNYCEGGLQKRGVKELRIFGIGSESGNHTLPRGNGSATEILFDAPQKTRSVQFEILSNHNDLSYPADKNTKPSDNGFVGLSEVQFLVKGDGPNLVPITNVSVKASSELVVDSHDRAARHLVDGSGLHEMRKGQGWNRQGMPFYGGKVEYSRTFVVPNRGKDDKYFVRLPNSPDGWYGATAEILVNGQSAGFLCCSPWQAEVSSLLKDGSNKVDVVVYGTPKNLLGQLHAGRIRGSGSPGSFTLVPEVQPPGDAYDSVGYGLFEPFVLLKE